MSRKFPRLTAAAAVAIAVAVAGFGAAVAFAHTVSLPRNAVHAAGTTGTTTTTTGTTTATTGTTTATTGTTTTTTGTTTTAPLPTVLAPVTQSPTDVGATSAVLNGTVDTEGDGGSWSFEYDTVSDYNGSQNDLSATSAQYIQPGSTSLTNVSAAIGCYPTAVCAADGETPLKPDTKYEYILQYNTGTGTKVADQYNSAEGTFSTDKYGLIRTASRTLHLSGRTISLPLTCSSVETCAGKARLAAKVHHRTVDCAASKFSIGAGDAKTVSLRLVSKCEAAVKGTGNGKLAATLSIVSTSDEPTVTEKVSLKDS